ncbi:MAG: response regulator [Chloroflexi bacterium]|nr:response regulator [Chloroflexota bacterium]
MPGERILVIDDSTQIIAILRDDLLIPLGYEVLTAETGLVGLNKAESASPALILLDLMLPDMSGLEVVERLREKGCQMPVILMTFYGSENVAVQAFRLGVRDYIRKPFDPDEVQAAIERALVESRLRTEKERLDRELVQANRRLERRVIQLSTLYAIGQSVTSLLELEQLLTRVVEAAVYLTNADEATLMLIDHSDGDLYLRAAKGVGSAQAQGFRIRVEGSLAGQVVRTGEPLMLHGAHAEPRLKIRTDYLVRALLMVPMRVGTKIIGVLGISNRVQTRPFARDEEFQMGALADYAAIAIENARLYGEIRNAYQELQTTQEQLVRAEKQATMAELAGATAHELNQPLTVLLGLIKHLQTRDPDIAHADELRMIVQAAEEMSRIVARLGRATRYETKPYVGSERIIDLERAAEGASAPDK